MEQINIKPNCEYTKYAPRWQRVRDIIDGEARLKEVDLSRIGAINGSSTINESNKYKVYYLRPINPQDRSGYNNSRNENYICGARLYNATVKTLSGLMGMLFRVEPVLPELPSSLEYLLTDVDGSGLDADQQIQSVAADVTQIGRDGLLVDMPRNDDGTELTQADVMNGHRATIQEYKAESVIDWHESVINGGRRLDLIVLAEQVECYTDALKINRESKEQLKVYRLDENGVTVQIFTQGENGLEESDQMPVLGAKNTKLTEIPFTFVGSKNNQSCVDNLPLEPISDINIGHYQESANLASSSFQLSACQPVISDDNYQRAARDPQNNSDKVELGEESMIVLGSTGSFALVSPPENNMSKAIQTDYAEQMIALGAQLITSGGMAETAEAARIKRASDVSDLELIARNVSSAYSQCIEWVCMFMGVEYNDDWTVEVNTNFFESKMTPQEQAELVKSWQAGAISKDVLDYNMQQGKIIKADEDLEMMNDAIEEEQGGDLEFDEIPVVKPVATEE